MSYEHSPYKEIVSDTDLRENRSETSANEWLDGDDVFVWDHTGDISIPPHFEEDIWKVNLWDRDLDTRSLISSC